MESFKKSHLKLVCAKLYCENRESMTKNQIVQYFMDSGVSKTTAYRYMSLFESGESFERKKGSGRPKIRLDWNERKKLDRMVNNKVFQGYRAVGRKLGFSEHTAERIMQDSGYKLRSRKNCPKSTPEQKQRQKTRLRKLRDLSRGHFIFHNEQ